MGGQALISSVFSLFRLAVFICHRPDNLWNLAVHERHINWLGERAHAAPKSAVPTLAAGFVVASEIEDVRSPLGCDPTG